MEYLGLFAKGLQICCTVPDHSGLWLLPPEVLVASWSLQLPDAGDKSSLLLPNLSPRLHSDAAIDSCSRECAAATLTEGMRSQRFETAVQPG